ncbi:MAG TPA: galactonate dehydratase, partial [Clostridia bacterium]|nr:galactonate dehydratase [Clostridia bacterium]
MRITNIKLYFVPVRFLYLKIETDEGVCGWGEPVVEGRASTVAAAVREFSDMLIGKNPLAIEHLWQTLYRGAFYRGGPVLMSAISGIDQALWDIKGKVLGVPVYELLGGAVKERVKVYRGIGGADEKALAEDALLAKRQGYRLVKFCPVGATHYVDTIRSVDQAAARVAAVREAVGNEVDIAVDFHGRVHKPMAKPLMDALRPYRLAFIEEAVLPTNNEVLSHLAQHTASPLATGERMYSRWDY